MHRAAETSARYRRYAAAAGMILATAAGEVPAPAPAPAAAAEIAIGFLDQARAPPRPASPTQLLPADAGLAGARLAVADDNRSGAFTGHSFRLVSHTLAPGEMPAAAVRALARSGIRFLVAHLDGEALAALADAPETRDLLLFNSRAADDALRNAGCRRHLLHTAPSRAMLADALAQYLRVKRWDRWFLVVGPEAGDRLYAAAVHRAARRFGASIVAEKAWPWRPGLGRSDTGHVTLQAEVPVLTRGPDHEVVIVADEGGTFGDYLPGRTDRPRPVAGTQGLTATGWSSVLEQWGASQLAGRFRRAAGRDMNAEDYAAWLAARSIAEAAIRSGSDDPAAIAAHLRGPDFLLAGFKGQGLSFRDWDGQMRQPILIADARMLISVSPQPGFLHRTSVLDTLGHDREESGCRFS